MSTGTRTAIRDPRRDERRRSWIIRGVATAVVVIVAAGIGIWLIATRGGSSTGPSPTVATAAGYFRVVGGATPKATLSITEDFQCPACRAFESEFGGAVEKIRAMPGVAVEYRPIAILDRSSTTEYSTRSGSASACVAESTAATGDWTTWKKFHDALFAQQPPEGGDGLSDAQLTSIARDVGAGDVGQCIREQRYGDWIGSVTDRARQDGLQGTPQIQLDGKDVALSTPQSLVDAVTATLQR